MESYGKLTAAQTEMFNTVRAIVSLEMDMQPAKVIEVQLALPTGEVARMRSKYPNMFAEAEQIHIEGVALKYKHAMAKHVELLSRAMNTSIAYLSQVVQGKTTEDFSELNETLGIEPVSNPSDAIRKDAAKTILSHVQNVSKKNSEHNKTPNMKEVLPSEFIEKMLESENRECFLEEVDEDAV